MEQEESAEKDGGRAGNHHVNPQRWFDRRAENTVYCRLGAGSINLRGLKRRPPPRNRKVGGVRDRSQQNAFSRSTDYGFVDLQAAGIHTRGTTGGHLDYRRVGRPAVARGAGRQGSRPASPVQEQPQTARPGGPAHVDKHGCYPSSGWGSGWVGDADMGFGAKQPGGWIYNLLPYLGFDAIHDIGAGMTLGNKISAAARKRPRLCRRSSARPAAR